MTPKTAARRWRQPGTWFWIPNSLLQQCDLPNRALVVYLALAYHANGRTQVAWPGQRRISGLLNMSRATVYKAIRDLEAYGFILKQHRRGSSNRYLLLHRPGVRRGVTPVTTVTSLARVPEPVLKKDWNNRNLSRFMDRVAVDDRKENRIGAASPPPFYGLRLRPAPLDAEAVNISKHLRGRRQQ